MKIFGIVVFPTHYSREIPVRIYFLLVFLFLFLFIGFSSSMSTFIHFVHSPAFGDTTCQHRAINSNFRAKMLSQN